MGKAGEAATHSAPLRAGILIGHGKTKALILTRKIWAIFLKTYFLLVGREGKTSV